MPRRTDKTPLDFATSMSADLIAENKKLPISQRLTFGQIVHQSCLTWGVLFPAVQKNLSDRSKLAREERAVKNYRKL